MLTTTIKTITATADDWWVCECGNNPGSGGFSPCDRAGNEVEPTPELWPESLCMCRDCGLVINTETVDLTAHTVDIIGRVTPVTH
jgi:hypothetical protein